MQVRLSIIAISLPAYSIQMLASSNVNIGIIAKNYEYFDSEKPNWNLRRNYLYLFDNMKNEIMKIDVSIGVSLLDRQESDKLKGKMEQIHSNIPNAKMAEHDKGPLYLQQYDKKGQV